MEMKLYNTEAKAIGKIELNDTVFSVEYNEPLIHQVVVAQLANKRQGTKSTLTRSEVRGGGRKPYRQKGTGRARQGSIRAPQYVKGGVVFAPKPRDFSQKINKAMNTAAIKSALSFKANNDEMLVVDKFELTAPKTREVAAVIKAFELKGKTLIVLTDDNADVVRAAANIPDVKTINASLINVYDLVASGKCVFTKEAVEKIEEAYAND